MRDWQIGRLLGCFGLGRLRGNFSDGVVVVVVNTATTASLCSIGYRSWEVAIRAGPKHWQDTVRKREEYRYVAWGWSQA